MDLLNNILNKNNLGLKGLNKNEYYYIRFTGDIKRDIKHGASYHATGVSKKNCPSKKKLIEDWGWDEYDDDGNELVYAPFLEMWAYKQKGLDAFELDAETDEEAKEAAKNFYYNSVYNSWDMPDYAVVVGEYVGDCPEGDQIKVKRIIQEVHS